MDNIWLGKRIIGLGGAVGVGKSTVLKMLAKLGIYTLSSDEIAASLLLKDAAGYQKIVEIFGEQVLDQSGQVDWIKLYKIISMDSQARAKFRFIINPIVRQEIENQIQTAEQSVIVVQAIRLDEFLQRDLYDQLWVITATEWVRLSNLTQKYGWTWEQAEQYIRLQHHQEVQLEQADVILFNNGSHDNLLEQVSQSLLGLKIKTTSVQEDGEPPDIDKDKRGSVESILRRLPQRNPSIVSRPISLVGTGVMSVGSASQIAPSQKTSGIRFFRHI
jgi:dephospho-CoA kinase